MRGLALRQNRVDGVLAMDASDHSNLGIWAVVLLAFGVLVLFLRDDGIPDRSRLTPVAGQLRSLEKSTSKGGALAAVRFSLSTDPRHFHYLSKAGRIDEVWQALRQAGRAEVGVLIDAADSHSPPLEERTYFMAYEVRVAQDVVSTHAQVAAAWRADNRVGAWLGYAAIAAGVALFLVRSLRQRPRP